MGAYIFLTVLILITCVLMILIVLVQNSKGGGLASNFSSSNQVMGVRKTTDFLEKATWTIAVALLVLTMASAFVIPRGSKNVKEDPQIELKIPASTQSPVETAPEAEPATTPTAQPDSN